jgi:hypothetical protein
MRFASGRPIRHVNSRESASTRQALTLRNVFSAELYPDTAWEAKFVALLKDKVTNLPECGPIEVHDEWPLDLDVGKGRARFVARKRAIQARNNRSLSDVVEAGVMPDGVRMFLFGKPRQSNDAKGGVGCRLAASGKDDDVPEACDRGRD